LKEKKPTPTNEKEIKNKENNQWIYETDRQREKNIAS